MPKRIADALLSKETFSLLIEAPSGAGKSMLLFAILQELVNKGARIAVLFPVHAPFHMHAMKSTFPELAKHVGKNLIFCHVEQKSEEEFVEDIAYASSLFKPNIIAIDPFLPHIQSAAAREIIKLLRSKKISTIVCAPPKKLPHEIFDFTAEIKVDTKKGVKKREVFIKSRDAMFHKHFDLKLYAGKVFLE